MNVTPSNIKTLVAHHITGQQLPDYYHSLVDHYLIPLSEQIANDQQRRQRPLVLGVNGGQGTGKSTICLFLKLLLENVHNNRCVVLSIDDFYLSRADRLRLAANVHPLLCTRGVPGTHDVDLAIATLEALLAGKSVALPQFDKASDDVVEPSRWGVQQEPVDIIILEGWCVGAIGLPEKDLMLPINQLEAEEDKDGRWRASINKHLASDYRQLFGFIDTLLMLKAPNMDAITEWRTLQEQKLAAKVGPQGASGLMNPEQIKRFIDHYERLTRYMLKEMPNRADIIFSLDSEHRVAGVSGLVKSKDHHE